MTIRSQITIPTSIFPTTHTTISPAYIPPIFNHTHYTTHSNYNTFSYSQLRTQCTPQSTIPTNQSYYSQHTSTHNHSKTMNRELWCVTVVGKIDVGMVINLRTYCHVSPILFGWFFVEASPTCFCTFVKCFFCNFICKSIV